MIFLYTFYNLLILNQQKFNYAPIETTLSLYDMKMNLYKTGAVWKLIFL